MTVRRSSAAGDRGFTLIEVLIVTSVIGIIVAALATAFTVIVRTTPTTEVRVDDARSTRGLQTWLSHDTTSTPPYRTAHDEGWIAPDDRCGDASDDEVVVEFRWREVDSDERYYVASYRFVTDGGEGKIVRVTCTASVPAGPYTVTSTLSLTAGLDPANPPWVDLNPASGEPVDSVIFNLVAMSGQVVQIETGSRNPVDFY